MGRAHRRDTMSRRLCVCYSNCQGGAAVHFLKKTPMAEHYDFEVYANYRLILGEQSPRQMFNHAAQCDLFLYQPTGEIYGILGTEELIHSVVPKSAQKISMAYNFNTGFFPIVLHGKWWTGEWWIEEAK